MDKSKDKSKRAEEIAVQILKYSRNELLVSLRFMDLALCKLEYKMENLKSIATDGKYLYYNPRHVFRLYETGNAELNHSYLHTIFHCIFYHPFINKTIDYPALWDLACDIAVEGIMAELNMKQLDCTNGILINQEIANLKAKYGKLTAERLYRKFIASKIRDAEVARLQRIFAFDEHFIWYAQSSEDQESKSKQNSSGKNKDRKDAQNDSSSSKEDAENSGNDAGSADPTSGNSDSLTDAESTQEEWQEISERVKVDIETSSKEWGDRSANLLQNITEVNRETYDYKEVKKVKEFVIAIDTSGSVQGDLVMKFITKTYNILAQQSNFFTRINVHIIQCDAEIQRDDKIRSKEEFEELMKNFKLSGFGGTDFRPVFNYVDELVRKKEFENLKGLIYFTDGYGTFPDKKPEYDTAFIFIDDDYGQPKIPVWAIKLVLAKDEI